MGSTCRAALDEFGPKAEVSVAELLSAMVEYNRGPQSFQRIDRLYLKNPADVSDGWSLRSVDGQVIPLVWEDDSIPVQQRTFPSDHGALLVVLEWVPPK